MTKIKRLLVKHSKTKEQIEKELENFKSGADFYKRVF